MTYEEFMADPVRKRSREVDYGVHWYHLERPWGYPWRISWIEATGELYAVELSNGDPLAPEDYKRGFVILGKYATQEEVEAALKGWADGPFRIGPLVNSAYLQRN